MRLPSVKSTLTEKMLVEDQTAAARFEVFCIVEGLLLTRVLVQMQVDSAPESLSRSWVG